MKRIIQLLLFLWIVQTASVAAVFPEVSTEGNEHWYYIQMQRGLAVLTSMGNG